MLRGVKAIREALGMTEPQLAKRIGVTKLPWCITFKFKNGEFSDVMIENYHRG